MGINTILAGLLIGALVAVAVSSFIALFQFGSGAPWKALLTLWGKMVVLTAPAFASTTAAALLAWHYRKNAAMFWSPCSDEYPIESTKDVVDLPPEGAPLSLSEEVVLNARAQAAWHYEWNIEPTRLAFEEQGVSQTIWNSGRHILTTARIVDGNKWAQADWAQIEQVLNGIHAEPDRVWIRPLGERTMVCLHIDERATGKRHTSTNDRPTPPVDEPEN